MAKNTTLHIRQINFAEGKHLIRLTLKRDGHADLESEATIEFALSPHERKDLRWYLEDSLRNLLSVEKVHIEQIETLMKQRGEELYIKVLTANLDTQRLWFAVHERLADLRVEITSGIAGAASIPWELMRDPQSDSPIALRVQAFVRVQSNPNISFVNVPKTTDRVRLLYIVCRPNGANDVALRAVANRLLQGLGGDLARFDIKALRPPTFEQLQKELQDAKEALRPYHIVHFDGHGVYADLKETKFAVWPCVTPGKHGYLFFEQPGSNAKARPVGGAELGQLLHDSSVPILVLNACQSAMHEAAERPKEAANAHDEVRAIGTLAQSVIDQGIPAVLGMRYSVFVVTAAQYIGALYASLAKGRGFGQAATEGRKHLHRNPDRWLGLMPRPLQDWFVPVVYEAAPLQLLHAGKPLPLDRPDLDPIRLNPALVRYVADPFVGRDETFLMLDRAFDDHSVVLLHAYAGQGKTTTAVEFSRWYAQTGGLGSQPLVLLCSFESQTDLADVLNQIGTCFAPILQADGIEWHALNDLAKRRNLVLRLLRQSPVFWIWDNVEPVAGFPEGNESQWTAADQSELADFLKQVKVDNATKVKILLTSRRDEQKWLEGIPHRVKMPDMSPDDAASLVLQLGGKKNFSPAEIAEWQPLLDYCAGNPLTLRVIVGQAVKMGLRGKNQIGDFIRALRDGEQRIEDADAAQGRAKSLGASLDYGFRHAFKEDELPVIALLHLFQGTVDVKALGAMGFDPHPLPEVKGKPLEYLTELLERASDTGLLAHLSSTAYTIHPALPWYLRQLFVRHYDGQDGRSGAAAASRVWVDSVSRLGNYYGEDVHSGNREAIRFLDFEEANLLHARRLARRHGWWRPVIYAMQGLHALYEYQGRGAEWARLVAEIVPDYCTVADDPVPTRQDEYAAVMGYRANLAKDRDRDFVRAAQLQEKLVKWNRQRAAAALALPPNSPFDDKQRNCIRVLAASLLSLGKILNGQGNGACVKTFEESARCSKRANEPMQEADAFYNLGHAYKDIPEVRDLAAAEAAYQHSLNGWPPNDLLYRSKSISQIGQVHHQRFFEAQQRNEARETLIHHARAAEQSYLEALDLCPASAIADLGPIHHQLGVLYAETGELESAREQLEKAAQNFEHSRNRYSAGHARHAIAFMYMREAVHEENPARRRVILLRAQAYAQASLRDFQHFDDRTAEEAGKIERMLDAIAHALDKLPL